MFKRIVFFQPRTQAKRNYKNSSGNEQVWAPWFALILAPAAHIFGYEVKIVDARVQENTWVEQIKSLTSEDILAVTVMTGLAILDALTASKIAKDGGAYVVWGGPHVTLFPWETLIESPADAVVPGFGFLPFWTFISRLSEPPQQISKIYGGTFYKFAPSSRTSVSSSMQAHSTVSEQYSERELPPPDLNLISDWTPYLNADIAIASRTVNFVTSEGCPRYCTFCSEPVTSQRKWYTRSVEQAAQISSKLVNQANANGLKLHDANFFHDLHRAFAFAQAFARTTRVPWAASIHPKDLLSLSDGVLLAFKHLGLCRLLIGLESPIDSILKLARKNYDASQIPVMAKRLAKAQIRGMFTFMVGWPNADNSHYDATIKCAYEIRRLWSEHQAKIHFLEPWPGTPIYRMLIKQGFHSPTSLEEWAYIDYYQAQFMQLQDSSIIKAVQQANAELSPYVNA